jgi:hypothetical protein
MMHLASRAKRLAKGVLNKQSRIALRRVYYFGNRYHCSVCGSNVRVMFEAGYRFKILEDLDVVGGEAVPLQTCPVCFSHHRTRLIHEYLRRETTIYGATSAHRVLHVAPEFDMSPHIANGNSVEYVPVDLDPARYEDIPGMKYCDVTAMRFPDNWFHIIICNHVLEHVPDDRRAMRELNRVLAPGGIALLQVPISSRLLATVEDPAVIDPAERERRFGQSDHVRIYASDYLMRLTESGFAVEVFEPCVRWTDNVVQTLRLNPREKLFIGRKTSHPQALPSRQTSRVQR